MNRSWTLPAIITAVVVVLLVLCCLFLVVIGAFWMTTDTQFETDLRSSDPSPSPQVVRPSVEGAPADINDRTLKVLENTIVPVNDLIDLTRRLKGISGISPTLEPPPAPYVTGQKKSFWVTNVDTTENFQIEATLRYVTDHVYFWVQNDVSYNESDLKNLAETFENEIYPTNREFFGSEWSPGVDGDPHLYILYAEGLGSSIAGYFSSADEYPPQAHQYSNAHEMFLLSAENVDLGEEFAYSVLAHEFQHMIHWYRDRNEETWMNEGFSEMAAFLNGYGVGGMDYAYVRNTDLQLNDWPEGSQDSTANYGASFLFLTYFLDRFGEDATKALVAAPDNGMVSIDQLLAEDVISDPLSGEPVGADEVFADWAVASYLQDSSVGDGRYTYSNYPGAPDPSVTEQVRSCPISDETRDVYQYGIDYIRITCRGDYTLKFEGSTRVGVVPVDPYSGDYAFWSNQGDESDMTLTQTFDFSDHSGDLTLSYWTWYDIEKDYDYVYLEASSDGENWQILITPSGTAENPSGNSFGWAYNGLSGGSGRWIQESVDISQFAGEQVQLRFEYVTDAAVNGEGFLLDDISISEIGYFSDFESGDGGWQADGFVRIENVLPQTYQISLIEKGRSTSVETYRLDGINTLEVPVQIGGDVDEVILVVSGTTRFTRQKAAYRFSLVP